MCFYGFCGTFGNVWGKEKHTASALNLHKHISSQMHNRLCSILDDYRSSEADTSKLLRNDIKHKSLHYSYTSVLMDKRKGIEI